jgi:hypothetical protein
VKLVYKDGEYFKDGDVEYYLEYIAKPYSMKAYKVNGELYKDLTKQIGPTYVQQTIDYGAWIELK